MLPKYCVTFLGYFQTHLVEVKTAVVTYWSTFEKWATFILTSCPNKFFYIDRLHETL